MKVIDFECFGNVVRFYLGANADNDYHGDDWDDKPYEHNAGIVYDYADTIDIAFPVKYIPMTPAGDWHYQGNSPFCKNDFKERKVPFIIVGTRDGYDFECYSDKLFKPCSLKLFYNDPVEQLKEQLFKIGCKEV